MTTSIELTEEERYMLRTILGFAREDECEGDEFLEEVAQFAERLYRMTAPPGEKS